LWLAQHRQGLMVAAVAAGALLLLQRALRPRVAPE
jgi:hypothetical protein